MFPGLDYILAGYVELVAAQKSIVCQPIRAPEITVTASSTKMEADHSRSIAELSTPIPGVKRGASPYGDGVPVMTEGLMLGSVKMPGNFSFITQKNANGQGCIHIDKVNVRIEINPKIYIAREYVPGTCYYNAIMEHEKKHVAVERFIVDKYTRVIGEVLKKNIDARGYVFGPFPAQHMDIAKNDLSKFLSAVVEPYAKRMEAERERLQSEVDSLAEYERVQRMCPNKE